MDGMEMVKALTVPLAAGFVVQRVVEILDTYTTAKIIDVARKKFVIGGISLGLGWMLASVGQIHIFSALQWTMNPYLDAIASGIFISGGSEGFNTLMKFTNYKKEASKADAAEKLNKAPTDGVRMVNPQPSVMKLAD
jgi:hypothetical protein